MNIQPDITIVIQFAFFAASYWVLSRLFFPPVRDVLEKRRIMMDEYKAERARKEKEGLEMTATYERKVREARVKAQEIRQTARKNASKEEREILGAAKAKAAEYMAEKNKELDGERQKSKKQFDDDVSQLADDIVGKLLQPRKS